MILNYSLMKIIYIEKIYRKKFILYTSYYLPFIQFFNKEK